MENSNNTRDAAIDNVNACLTSLEEYVGADHGKTVGDQFPNASIALKEMLTRLDELFGLIENINSEASDANSKADLIHDSTNRDKQQSLIVLRTLIDRSRQVEAKSAENKATFQTACYHDTRKD
eukprot:2624818-Ditylum_brightwellii.AAC.1